MIKHIIFKLPVFILLSTIFSQEILFITPTQGVQGSDDLEITLVASGVNFYDEYSYHNVYFSGSGLNTSSQQIVSSNSINFNLDIENYTELGNYDIFLSHSNYGWNNWTVSLDNAFTVLQNMTEIVSVTPNTVQAGEITTVTINGYQTDWDSNTTVYFGGYGIDVISTFSLSPNILIVEIDIDPFAYTGWHSLTTTSNGVQTTTNEGINVTLSNPMQIAAITPDTGMQGTNDLLLNITVFNGNFNDEYADRSLIFSGNGIHVNNTWPMSSDVMQAQIDINSWAEVGPRDIILGVSGPYGEGQWQYDTLETGFTVLPSQYQLLSISPSVSYASTYNFPITLIGQNTSWTESNPELSFSGNGFHTDFVNVLNDTLIQAQIDIYSYANTGFSDVSINSNNQLVGIQNGFEIRSPEIISLTPNSGVQSQQDLTVSLVAGGVNFYDEYSYVNNIYFSGSGLNTSSYSITSSNTLDFQLDITNSATPNLRDIHLIQYQEWSGTTQISKTDAFSVIDSDDVIWGCLDTTACNYNEIANIDDGSCEPDTDGDSICDNEDYFISILDSSYPNYTSSVTVPINLEVYSSVIGMQFTILDSASSLTFSSIASSIDGFTAIGSSLPDGSTQITIYSTSNSLIPIGFNGIICELNFGVIGDLINTEIELNIINAQIFDEFSNLISIEEMSGFIIFGSVDSQGDMNNDGLLNILDLVIIINHIMSNEYSDIGDVNQDGLLNILDIVTLVNIILDT